MSETPLTEASRSLISWLAYPTGLSQVEVMEVEYRLRDIEAQSAARADERLRNKARKWRDEGMFTEGEWGAVCAVLGVESIRLVSDSHLHSDTMSVGISHALAALPPAAPSTARERSLGSIIGYPPYDADIEDSVARVARAQPATAPEPGAGAVSDVTCPDCGHDWHRHGRRALSDGDEGTPMCAGPIVKKHARAKWCPCSSLPIVDGVVVKYPGMTMRPAPAPERCATPGCGHERGVHGWEEWDDPEDGHKEEGWCEQCPCTGWQPAQVGGEG